MLHGHLRPGYDYLLERKFSSLWRELGGSTLGGGPGPRSCEAAAELGFSERVATATASQVPARLLIQTGRRLGELTAADLDEFAAACRERQQRTGRRLAALPVGAQLHPPGAVPPRHPGRPAGTRAANRCPSRTGSTASPAAIATAMTAYLELKMATCKPKTVSSLATRLMHFGRFLTAADPGLAALAALDRRRHIEPYLASPGRRRRQPAPTAVITLGEQHAAGPRGRGTSSPTSPPGDGTTHPPGS